MKKKKATAQKKRVKHGQQRKNNVKRAQNSAKQQKKSSSAAQQKKNTVQQKKSNAEQPKKSSSVAQQKKNTGQQKKSNVEQPKKSNAEQPKKSNAGQAKGNSSSVQKKVSAERRKGKPEQKRSEWKEILYNCPYVLGIVFTSLLVMLWSDEIGFKAIAREAQTVMVQSGMFGNSGQTELEKHLLLEADDELSADKSESKAGNEDVLENNSEIDDEPEENAGKRKDESNDKENDNNLENDINSEENIENTEESRGNGKGITKFEIYDPQEIDSIYYSDAGKVALTTEYPYTKENIGYFHDAAFLGDSRTLGISDYAGLEEADFYCDSGMMIFKLLEDKVTYQKTGDKVDLNQVLQEKQYGKIYIMLGMNELGYGNTEMYLEQYRKVLNQIKEWQPQAIIYVMANLHVSREKNNMETEFNNININDKNAASAKLANGMDIFYLDVNPLFTDSDGFLNADLSFDGVHLYAQHYDVWREFLLEHAVEPAEVAEE